MYLLAQLRKKDENLISERRSIIDDDQQHGDLTHNQHQPIVVEVYFRYIPPTSRNNTRFVGVVTSTAKICLRRCYFQEHVPGWPPKQRGSMSKLPQGR
nr:unnamed protein product [Callosobruchus analis]